MSALRELQKWYGSQCNGDWEHQYGIKIDTLDNPGWTVTIDLDNTGLEKRVFQSVESLQPELDWIKCWVEGNKFIGVGGPQKLEKIIEIFLNWVERDKSADAKR